MARLDAVKKIVDAYDKELAHPYWRDRAPSTRPMAITMESREWHACIKALRNMTIEDKKQ